MKQRLKHGQPVTTVTEAAQIFGRSTTWVRNRIIDLQLQTLHPYGLAPVLITKASIHELLEEMRRTQAPARRRALLRLVVDNTK